MKTWKQYLAVFLCTISVTATGITFTWLEPLLELLTDPNGEFKMTTSDTSWLVSSIELGEVIFTIPSGMFADWIGRKWTLYTVGPLHLIAWTLVLTTRSVLVLYIVRFIQGINMGTVYALAPMYIAEVAEPKVRGLLSGNFQTMWAIGLIISYVTGPYLSYNNYTYACALLAVIFSVLFVFVPETPYYLLMNGNDKKAKKSLIWLRGKEQVDEEFNNIKKSVDNNSKNKASLKALFATKQDRKIFLIVQVICFIKHMIGSPAICAYASDMFKEAGGSIDERTMTIVLGVLLIVSAFVGSFMSDCLGRRPLLIGSTVINTGFHIVSATFYYLHCNTNYDVSDYTWIIYITVSGSCIVQYIGLGLLLQTLQAELFPSHTRGIGGGVTGITASVSCFIGLKQYQPVLEIWGMYMNFVIFAFFGFIGAIIMYYVIPETKGKSLGDIQKGIIKTKIDPNIIDSEKNKDHGEIFP